jgi:hypothetical protein
MTSLRDLQLAFASAIRTGDAALVAGRVAANGIPADRRVAIYANNVRENFLGTLEATFPVLAQLGGRDWLRGVGTTYLRDCPSRSGNLHFVGERFACFLGAALGDTPYAYFQDVARLEWAYQEVLVAREPGVFDRDALALLAPARHGTIVFAMNPAARLVDSVYPLLAIWQANRPECAQQACPEVSLDAGASRLLVLRRRDHVELRDMPAGDFAFLSSIARQRPLATAAEDALHVDPDFDLPQALTRLVQLEAITGWRLPDSNPISDSPSPEFHP